MRCGCRWVGLLALAAGALSVGCNRTAVRRNDPPDPLLMTKTPVQSKYVEAQPVAVRSEPTPPAIPAGAVEFPVLTPGQPTVPASRNHLADHIGLMIRSRDFRWVQGILEHSAGDQWLLRYEDVSRDQYGGKLLLASDPRLNQFHTGDVVRVEGTILSEEASLSRRAWVPHPDYRIGSIQLIQEAR